ncbi:hypothetical protein [Actinophytocola sp.]|uniref:hypothetical protein n=1 Tax=Actinophytocola sp. TaxID=1872138 RepID=UPI002ED3A1DE
MSTLNGDANIEALAGGLKDAAEDLELLANENTGLVGTFDQEGWSGLDVLTGAAAQINGVRDVLVQVADKIGVGGQIVLDAHLNNPMIRNASKASLGLT